MSSRYKFKGESVENQEPSDEAIPGDRDLFLSDRFPQLRPWDAHKAASRQLSEVFRCDAGDAPRPNQKVNFRKYANRTYFCSEFLAYGWQADADTGELSPKLKYRLACHIRLCPVCQWRRSHMWTGRMMETYPQIIASYPKSRFLLLTLTIRNCEVSDLRQTLKHLNSSWRRLLRRGEFSAVEGWIKTTEITRGRDGLAHPHFHCLLMVEPRYFGRGYIKHDRWVELWRETAKLDYDPQVDIRVIKSPMRLGEESRDVLPGGIVEVLKYTVKPKDLDVEPDSEAGEWVRELTHQLYRTRAIDTGGVLRGLFRKMKKDDFEDKEEGEEEGPVSLYAYNKGRKRYVYKRTVLMADMKEETAGLRVATMREENGEERGHTRALRAGPAGHPPALRASGPRGSRAALAPRAPAAEETERPQEALRGRSGSGGHRSPLASFGDAARPQTRKKCPLFGEDEMREAMRRGPYMRNRGASASGSGGRDGGTRCTGAGSSSGTKKTPPSVP